MEGQRARRRQVLKAALSGAVAAGTAGAVRLWPGDGSSSDGDRESALTLAADDGEQISSVTVPLDDTFLGRRTGSATGETAALSTSPYSMLAVTWHEATASPVLDVRSRNGGRWSQWRRLTALHDLPDVGSGEAALRGGTDLAWVGPSDGVQVRVTGRRPPGLSLVLLYPWPQPGDDAQEVSEASSRAASASGGLVPRPDVRGRKRWAAKESWRDGRPRYNRTIKQVHVHHTAGSNDYRRRDVPALLRGIYRYHTHHLGWSDIGYNFLVDRFGRIWTGRAGGANRAVRGAHTLGFNSKSTGISVIGNFETATPSAAVLDAVAAVAAWKLREFARDPLGSVHVRSQGSDRFRRGKVVTLPVIDGHRDTNDTACPGRHLYAELPEIRRRTAHLIAYYSKVHVLQPAVLTGEPALGQTLTVDGGSYLPADASLRYVWMRNGTPIPGAQGHTYVVRPADAGAHLAVRVVAHKRGLKAARRRLDAPGRVKAASIVTINAAAKDHRSLRVGIRVTSPPGVRAAQGRVVVKVAGHRAVVRLSDGHGVARFGSSTPLQPGRYGVRARYLGDRAHDPSTAKVRVRIRRRG